MNINTAGLAEGLGLGDALGIDLDVLREVFSQTGANSRVLETDGADMQNREHDVYFSAAHAAKDSGIALELAREAGLNFPLARATFEQYEKMKELGLGELDKSGVSEITFQVASRQRSRDPRLMLEETNAAETQGKIVPLISPRNDRTARRGSSPAPVAQTHARRLGALPDGYDECGAGFDGDDAQRARARTATRRSISCARTNRRTWSSKVGRRQTGRPIGRRSKAQRRSHGLQSWGLTRREMRAAAKIDELGEGCGDLEHRSKISTRFKAVTGRQFPITQRSPRRRGRHTLDVVGRPGPVGARRARHDELAQVVGTARPALDGRFRVAAYDQRGHGDSASIRAR